MCVMCVNLQACCRQIHEKRLSQLNDVSSQTYLTSALDKKESKLQVSNNPT